MNDSVSVLTHALQAALAVSLDAQKALGYVAVHANCSRQLRKNISRFDADIDAVRFFGKANIDDLCAILSEIEGWLEAEARLDLIWDEGCAHEGWFEWILPPHMKQLNDQYKELRQFLTALRNVQCLLAIDIRED